ncbi:MAG TPA: TonB family protein, partial [Polyangiaceae bacterium]
QTHAKSGETQPSMTIRFDVDAGGNVKSASLVPSSLGATPLGQCVLGVARGTSFGPQPEPVAFSIPIVTRVIRR